VGWVDEKELQCAWKKQPETPEEFDRAIAVLHTQELGCHRYAGSDPAILRRLPTEVCDEPTEAPNVRANENIGTPIPLRLSMPQEKPGLIRGDEADNATARRIAVARKRRATQVARP
jgi:hypothetical protein